VQIVVNEEKFSIGLKERIRQVRRKLTDEDRTDRSRYFSANQTWTQEKFASGELVLTISEQNSYGLKRQWSDMTDAPLESKLGEVLPEVAGMFEKLRLRRIAEAEARERHWKEEQERHRRETERKREMVRDRRLLRHCQDWNTANSIRAFIAAVEASPLPSASPAEFAAWKHRALDYAGRLDPLGSTAMFDLNVTDHETYSLRQ
jgi:hypothetical protein